MEKTKHIILNKTSVEILHAKRITYSQGMISEICVNGSTWISTKRTCLLPQCITVHIGCSYIVNWFYSSKNFCQNNGGKSHRYAT